MAISSRSTLEDRVQANLQKRGINYTYEPCKLPYTVERNYIPDLLIGDIYIEVKGYFRQDAFQRAASTVQGAKIRKDGTKMTCGEWATKQGFIWAEGNVPDDWLIIDDEVY